MSEHVNAQQRAAGETAGPLPRPRGAWLTRGQITLRAVQFGLLGVILLVMLLVNFEGTSLLFRDPLGRKMLLQAMTLLACGLALHLLACAALNQLAPPGDEALRARRRVLSWLLESAYFLIFYLPVVFVLVVGPAALTIMDALARP